MGVKLIPKGSAYPSRSGLAAEGVEVDFGFRR